MRNKGDGHYLFSFPVNLEDRRGNCIYLTEERWEHALDHPGMHEGLLDYVMETLKKGERKQDAYDPLKFKYSYGFSSLPMSYTHIVVVVKFGWSGVAEKPNNFVLTAYLIEKW